MILLFGDVHSHFDHVLPTVQVEQPAAVILLGDIQARRPLEQELAGVMELTKVYWIPGNHDTDSQGDYDHLFKSALADRNLHGRVVEIDALTGREEVTSGYALTGREEVAPGRALTGKEEVALGHALSGREEVTSGHSLRVAGLGGIFRQKVWWPEPIDAGAAVESYDELQQRITQKLTAHTITSAKAHDELLRHRSTIFPDEWQRLSTQQADILVTHEAPSCHPAGFRAIDLLAQRLGVKTAFHGHHHDRIDYAGQWARLGFRAYGVGLWGVTDMEGQVVAPGMLDARIRRFPVG